MASARSLLPCCNQPTTPPPPRPPPRLGSRPRLCPLTPIPILTSFLCVCAGTGFLWHPVGAYFHQAGLWQFDANPHGCLIPYPSWHIVLYRGG